MNSGALVDPIVLSIEDTIQSFLHLKEDLIPQGFRDWRKFGSPPGSPGQSIHHPGLAEHKLYGWLLAMHFLAVLELVAFLLSKEEYNDANLDQEMHNEPLTGQTFLPAPIHGKDIDPQQLHSLFYGFDTGRSTSTSKMVWKMNPIQCYTTFDPILKNNLQDIIVSGTVGEDLDIMLPRGSQLYNKGWVLDLGASEKKAKRKLERYGGLGYIDKKLGYYGISVSGVL